MGAEIGSGQWSCQVVSRGGSPLLHEVGWSSISTGDNLNSTGRANIDLPTNDPSYASCAEVLRDSEPWRDEVLLWRDDHLAHAGPLVTVSASNDGGSLFSPDLSQWLEHRFLPDFHGDGDVADVFEALFNAAMDPDTSPNLSIAASSTGIPTVQDYEEVQYHRASDAMRTLTEVGIDWTMVGRTMIAALELFASEAPLILHDDGVVAAEVTKEGANLATDYAVFGSSAKTGGSPATGRATTGDELYGLIQRSSSELLLKDNASCDSSALAHLRSMQPAPRRLRVTLGPGCAFSYEQAVPGRQVDVRLSEAAGAGRIVEVMRLQTKDVDVGPAGETVRLNLVPLGLDRD